MNDRASPPARALAAIALVGGVLVLIIVIGSSLGGDGGTPVGGGQRKSPTERPSRARKRPVPATYVVQNGDTLTSIAHRTGVSVARIQALNPSVDPQVLISGEKLRLR